MQILACAFVFACAGFFLLLILSVTSLPILYSFRRCPYAMRARLAIAASGVQCELREVVLRNKPEALLQASPKATVPVVVLESGQVLEQSLDIMLWALGSSDPQSWLVPEQGGQPAMLALIQECDEGFKPQLDRYKYPQRFAHEGQEQDLDAAARWHRERGAQWLGGLEARLEKSAYLFGGRASLADMAIAPFVRQYAHVSREWFDAQPWPHLLAWLNAWMTTALFERVMQKHPAWEPGAEQVLFP